MPGFNDLETINVRPLAGAGIEISLRWSRYDLKEKFAPSRGRELKYRNGNAGINQGRSPPRGGGN